MFQCHHSQHGPEVTLKDCKNCPDYARKPDKDAQKLVLYNNQSPGDHLVMSAAIVSLHMAHPGKYITDVDVPCPDIYLHNPWVTKLDRTDPGVRAINMTYNGIHQSNQRHLHFMQAFCDDLSKNLGVPVPLAVNRPQLYFSREEKTWISRVHEVLGEDKPFWICLEGGKQDYTCKTWPHHYWQQFVDLFNNHFQGQVILVQAGEAHHTHRPLQGVLNQIGKTNTREFIRLCRQAQGGIGPVTFAQHIFASLARPYICLSGGRESKLFTEYATQTTLHTIGMLKCCSTGGCWRSRTVALGDGDAKDNDLCTDVVQIGGEPAQRCMSLITPHDVFRAVVRYYEGGALPLPTLPALDATLCSEPQHSFVGQKDA